MKNFIPSPRWQFFNSITGHPLVGGLLYTYAAGTTTPVPTYTTAAGGTANTNPIVLDARGEAAVWCDDVPYKFILTTAGGTVIWTEDNHNVPNTGEIVDSAYQTLAEADAAAVAAGRALVFSKQWDVVPSTIFANLRMVTGGKFNNTGALTLAGNVDGDMSTHFIGAGAVTLKGKSSIVWFGAKGDGVVNNYAAILACMNATTLSNIIVPVDKYGGDYNVLTAIILPTSIAFEYEAGARIYGSITNNSSGIRFGGGGDGEGGDSRDTSGLEIIMNNVGQGTTTAVGVTHNYIAVLKDCIDMQSGPGEMSTAFLVDQTFGGAAAPTTGSRQTLMGRLIQSAPGNILGTQPNYVAVVGQTISATGDGGTVGATRGGYFGSNFWCQLKAGALHCKDNTAVEVNTLMEDGASSDRRIGISLAGGGLGGNSKGTLYDAAATVTAMGTNPNPWKHGVLIGSINSVGRALTEDGCILRCTQAGVIAEGIVITTPISDFIFDYSPVDGSMTYKVNLSGIAHTAPAASLSLGGLTAANTPHINFRSSGFNIGYSGRILASGGTVTLGEGALTYVGKEGQIFDTDYLRPKFDNTTNLGAAAYGFKELFCDNGTINVSDGRLKTEVTPFNPEEISAAKELAGKIGWYQWLAAVELKGEAVARHHIGFTVQQAIEVMEAHNLDPMKYGFICYDEWQAHPEVRDGNGTITQDEIRLDDGDIIENEWWDEKGTMIQGATIMENGKVKPPVWDRIPVFYPTKRKANGTIIQERIRADDGEIVHPATKAGNRYSFRPDQLDRFIMCGLLASQQELVARLDALEER